MNHEFFQSGQGEGSQSPQNRRGIDPLVEIMAHHIKSMREDMGEMKQSVTKLTEAVTKLVLLEERQSNTTAELDRVARSVTKLDSRLQMLERAQPMAKQVSQWVLNAVWGGAGMLVALAVSKVFGG